MSPTSFANVKSKWWPEITHHCPTVPIVLVGTKIDLRSDADSISRLSARGGGPISIEQGEALAREIGAVRYVENR